MEVIDIGKEQAKLMADLKVFKEAADAFTPDEYWTDRPYALLRSQAQYSWNQFDQFAEVLIYAAVAAGADESFIREAVALERYLYIESPPTRPATSCLPSSWRLRTMPMPTRSAC